MFPLLIIGLPVAGVLAGKIYSAYSQGTNAGLQIERKVYIVDESNKPKPSIPVLSKKHNTYTAACEGGGSNGINA